MADSQLIAPICKYGHGALVLNANEGNAEVFSAGYVNRKDNLLDLGRGFSFVIYKCPVCSYLEFHDYDLNKP